MTSSTNDGAGSHTQSFDSLGEHLADLEWAYGIVTLAEAGRAGLTRPRPLDDLIDDLGLTREEIVSTPDA